MMGEGRRDLVQTSCVSKLFGCFFKFRQKKRGVRGGRGGRLAWILPEDWRDSDSVPISLIMISQLGHCCCSVPFVSLLKITSSLP